MACVAGMRFEEEHILRQTPTEDEDPWNEYPFCVDAIFGHQKKAFLQEAVEYKIPRRHATVRTAAWIFPGRVQAV